MADEHGYAHAGGTDFDFRVEDFFGFVDHFPFFFRHAIIHEHIDMRDHVIGDLLREFFWIRFVVREGFFRLVIEFIHPFFAGTGNGLIGRDDYAFDFCGVMQWLQCDDHLDG